MTILLKDIWPIENTDDFKIHFARHDGHDHPLDVWVHNKDTWREWQEYRYELKNSNGPKYRNDFNELCIFSLMQFHHEPGTWLFGGVFKVLDWPDDDYYKVELTDIGSKFIGRLKIKSSYNDRPTRIKMDTCYSEFEVKEILSEPYSGQAFPGFEDIDLSFKELESLVKNNRLDWKTALENVKGVYLLTDTKTGKRYVGSAYGEGGVWSRWKEYMETGHGKNVATLHLFEEFGVEYCKKHFRFALLEHRPFNTSNEKISPREEYWKKILLTRGEYGLNRN